MAKTAAVRGPLDSADNPRQRAAAQAQRKAAPIKTAKALHQRATHHRQLGATISKTTSRFSQAAATMRGFVTPR